MIFRSPEPPVAVPEVPLTPFLLERAAARGDKPALIDAPSGRTLSYRGWADATRRAAAGLAARGFGKGDFREKVVMGDARHTQRQVSIQIVESGGEYILFAKGNQPQMEENIRLWFEPDVQPIPGMSFPPKDLEPTQQTNKGHGRLETRTITVSSQLKDFLDWPYLEQVFKLERRFVSLKTGEIREQIEYGFTSLTREEITPLHLLDKTRSYWGIENGLHYRRDVTLREDSTRMTIGKAGQAVACLNNMIWSSFLSSSRSPPALAMLR